MTARETLCMISRRDPPCLQFDRRFGVGTLAVVLALAEEWPAPSHATEGPAANPVACRQVSMSACLPSAAVSLVPAALQGDQCVAVAPNASR